MSSTTFQPPCLTWRAQWALTILVALVISNILIRGPLPFARGYEFPIGDFLTLLLTIALICEANKAVYRYLDKRMPFDQHTIRRLTWQGIGSFLATLALFIPAHLVKAALTHEPISLKIFLFYGFVAFSISIAANGVHLIAYFVSLMRYKERTVRFSASARPAVTLHPSASARLSAPEAQTSQVVPEAQTSPIAAAPLSRAAPAEAPATLAVETGNRTLMLDPQQISWWHSSGGTVSLVKTDGVHFTTNYTSFAMITDKLPGKHFFHLTRQVIAHRKSIDSIQNSHNGQLIVMLKTPDPGRQTLKVLVSRYKKAAFQTWMDGQTN